MKTEELEVWLKSGTPLEVKLGTLIDTGLPTLQFVSLAEDLIRRAGQEEKARCKGQIFQLDRLIKGRRMRLQLNE